MAAAVQAVLSSIQTSNPSIQLYTTESSEYDALLKTFILTSARPTAIARPKNADEVAALVKACRENQADFTIRTGGHSCAGETLIDNSLVIDMRDIAYVEVSEDKKSAKIGGGVQLGGLLKTLGEHGLVTPCGTVSSVGYVGWSTLGGYGPFLSLYGFGADQILGAKLVRSNGEVFEADDDLLKGIRGAGPVFGPIVELTIKVYPLKEMLSGTIIFDSSDMVSAWSTLSREVQNLALPNPGQLQFLAMEFPGVGKVTGMLFTWVSDDHDEGRKWFEKIASLAPNVMKMVEPKTALKMVEDNNSLVTYGVYGRSYTISLKKWTPEVAAVLGKHNSTVPYPSCMICVHSLRADSAFKESVFASREAHHMVEIIAMTADAEQTESALAWGQQVRQELRETDQSNILSSTYISLEGFKDTDLSKIYNENLPTLVDLKRKYDADNVFRNGVPRVI
ncbi:unnamed protein product [Clonostachys byssicola]|uniref:FAD-binding PCMH-type domain-containing protein n=1 Tax=Clonostachys byssicola TaxID=160290 RepID=A0A9N9Y8F6_9HYPO|nr:unnamed protein product [Clonostachys byssicola]